MRPGYSRSGMSSWLRRRAPTGTMLCWLLVVCLAAISATTPLLEADLVVDSAARHHALPADDPGPPSAPAGSTAAAIDDLSGPAATAVFHLSAPAVSHHMAPAMPTLSLAHRAHTRAGERAPPAPLS